LNSIYGDPCGIRTRDLHLERVASWGACSRLLPLRWSVSSMTTRFKARARSSNAIAATACCGWPVTTLLPIRGGVEKAFVAPVNMSRLNFCSWPW
jgi:hypothetical protein